VPQNVLFFQDVNSSWKLPRGSLTDVLGPRWPCWLFPVLKDFWKVAALCGENVEQAAMFATGASTHLGNKWKEKVRLYPIGHWLNCSSF